MPTYSYQCRCGEETDVVESIARHRHDPQVPEHCGEKMQRIISISGGCGDIAYSLAGDRSYEGLRATDGADISSRSKHRAYMKAKGLTTVDDFKDTLGRAQRERESFRRAEHRDRDLRNSLAQEVYRRIK